MLESPARTTIYSGATAPVWDQLWADTSETAVTDILTPVWSEEKLNTRWTACPQTESCTTGV